MGCGISKFDIAKEGEAPRLYTQLSLVHQPNDRAIANSCLLSKTLPEGGRREENHAKGDSILKKVNIEEKGIKQREKVEKEEACSVKEGSEEEVNDRDDSISYIRSPSFRVYCIPSQSDDGNSEGESNLKEIKDDQQVDVENDYKGSSTGFGKTNGIRKEKKSFKSRILRYMFQSS